MANYQVAMHRQERVNGTLQPEEDVVLAIRREPRAVRLTWPSGPNKGREVLYRADEPGGQMHVKMANPALPRLSLPPDSPMVMRNSRHPVTEAGFDSIVEGLENAVKTAERSGIAYAGLETAEGLDQPHHCLTRTTPAGETWRVYLDPQTHLPSLVQADRRRRASCSNATSSATSGRTCPNWPRPTPSTPTPDGDRPAASSAGSPGATPTDRRAAAAITAILANRPAVAMRASRRSRTDRPRSQTA